MRHGEQIKRHKATSAALWCHCVSEDGLWTGSCSGGGRVQWGQCRVSTELWQTLPTSMSPPETTSGTSPGHSFRRSGQKFHQLRAKNDHPLCPHHITLGVPWCFSLVSAAWQAEDRAWCAELLHRVIRVLQLCKPTEWATQVMGKYAKCVRRV